MTWLVAIGLTNAVLAGVLAVLAWGVSRYAHRPALARLMWLLVLLKLLAPPVYHFSPGDWFAVSMWLSPPTAPPATSDLSSQRGGDLSSQRGGDLVWPRSGGGLDPPGARIASAEKLPEVASNTPAAATEVRSRAAVRSNGWATRLAAVLRTAWFPCVAVVWMSGSAVCAVRLAYRACQFHRFLARVAHEDRALTERVARLSRDARLPSRPRVLVVESAVSPMLWGAGRRACLLFPAELLLRLDTAACDTLLLHELAHYARGDWLVRVVELAAHVAYWWFPLVWWTLRQIEAAEEECCDAWVVTQRAGERRLYAEALLATVDFLSEPLCAPPPAACGLGDAGSLRSRLTQIICGDVPVRTSWIGKSLIFILAAVALPTGPSMSSVGPREAAARGILDDAGLPTGSRATHRLADGHHEIPLADASGHHAHAPRSIAGLAANSAPPLVPVDAAQPATRDETIAAAPAPRPWFHFREPAARLMPARYATAVSPNGHYQLEARTGRRVALVDMTSNKRLDLSAYCILAASFSSDSRLLATGQEGESSVRLWDSETGEVRALLKGSAAEITSVAFAPDARRVAAGAADGSVHVWSLEDNDVVARLARQPSPVSCLRWSKGGQRLAIAHGDWSHRDSSSLIVWQPAGNQQVNEFSLAESVGAIEWLADEELIVADWSGAARVIDLSSGRPGEVFWLDKDVISAAAFSPDCRLNAIPILFRPNRVYPGLPGE